MESADFRFEMSPDEPIRASANDVQLGLTITELVVATEKEVLAQILSQVKTLETAQDLMQETFHRAWAARHRFDPAKDGRAWIRKIAKNVVYTHFRSERAQKRKRPPQQAKTPIDDSSTKLLDGLILADDLSEMDRAAAALNDSDRALYELRRKGLSMTEIATATGRSKQSLGPAWTRVQAKLRAKMSHD